MPLLTRFSPLVTLFALALPIHAATHCVIPSGAGGCYKTISGAVNAAAPNDVIQVAPGVYHEAVVIRQSLSLTTTGATVDATGLPHGIFIDGIDAPGLSHVHISGFTVQNAKFEGILIANSSAVTVALNRVTGNNRALVPSATGATCPGLPDYETNEGSDCGEGIHLLGADHAILTQNTITGNSGGILVSDDTAPNHDNVITFNKISGNPYACGISLASHPAVTHAADSFGVYHNTVYANTASNDGAKAGGGAGVGIFASVPGAQSYGNVVVNNLLTDNGLPGIAMHAHAPNQLLNDNVLLGNIVLNNGADTEDAATPGPAGINLYSFGPATGNIILDNVVGSESYDVAVNAPSPVQVEFNDLFGPAVGVANLGTAGSIDATSNWWTCSGGPQSGFPCASVSGPDVLTAPALPLPVLPQPITF